MSLDAQDNAPAAVPADAENRILHIRRRAIRALDGTLKAGRLNTGALFRELKSLAPPDMPVYRLEAIVAVAVVAVAVVGRIKPAKTFDRLTMIKDKRTQAGELPEFDAFQASIENHLGGYLFTRHGYETANFANLDHSAIWKKVNRNINSLSEQGYQVFLNSGTLLGVVRDKRLIDHDDDIDLAVVLKARTTQDAAQEWASLSKELLEQGTRTERAGQNPKILELDPAGGLQIDLFPCWIEGGKVYVYPHTFGEFAEDDLLSLTSCAVSGNKLPADPMKMLAVNYGENWKRPDVYFKSPWPRANKIFKDFADHLEAFQGS